MELRAPHIQLGVIFSILVSYHLCMNLLDNRAAKLK